MHRGATMISNAIISFTRLRSMINQPAPQIKRLFSVRDVAEVNIVYGIDSPELQI